MIKNYRKQKIVIKEKHIELLNKRKEENLRLQQNKIDELNKIRGDVEKIGGEWKCQQEIADNLNNIAKSKKIEAVKVQIKFQRLILKKNPSDKAVFTFSIQGRPLELCELLENLSNLLKLSGSPEKDQSSDIHTKLIIKSKEEREQFMAEQRGSIIEKIQNLRKKNSENNKTVKKSDYVPPRKRSKQALSHSSNETDCDDVSDLSVVYNFKLGDVVAIAYSDSWYPGQVEEIKDDSFAKVKCLHPTNSKKIAFHWPNKDDIILVENIFIFESEFEMVPKDSNCRSFAIPEIENINKKYEIYKAKYF
ncbi:unnamed protein product [Mytilus coruscus]|uniref:Uncharacterized protein n=1 Tax=Mytilus coruscus TaxID=42192 RepID=A0A6J8D4K5_MYTCO|nr:unnamed protein product [Mytilus coruscus]